MTGQDLLDRMELLNQELQLQAGETDVTRGLRALNVSQDYFESLAALRPNVIGSTTGTVTTSASTETTTFPTGVLRIDRLTLLDASSLPKWDLRPLRRTGGHRSHRFWPWVVLTSGSTGEPVAYWTNGRNIYWNPLPSGTSTVRWYGFKSADDITAAGTFGYADIVSLPIAAFAVRLVKSGLDDNAQDLSSLAVQTFKPALDALSMFNRDGASGLEYTEIHTE